MAAVDAAALLGGATPFGWASMAAGVLGSGAAKAAPAGPSQSNPFFGSSMFNADSSGWLVNFGDGSEQSQSNAAKTGPSLTGNNPGAAVLPAGSGGTVGVSAAIPMPLIMIGAGAVLLILLLKKGS